MLRLVAHSFSQVVHAVLAARPRIKVIIQNAEIIEKQQENECSKKARNTDPQLRHRLEQVKYSSGKKQLCATSSPAISPLKRSLSACRRWPADNNIKLTKLKFTFWFASKVEAGSLYTALPAGLWRWPQGCVGNGWRCYPGAAPVYSAGHESPWVGWESVCPSTGQNWKPPENGKASWSAPTAADLLTQMTYLKQDKDGECNKNVLQIFY